MIKDFIFYGFLGWIMEVFWTGIIALKRGDKKLVGYTYLYMFPIYGCAVFMEPVFMLLHSTNFVVRGLIYMLCIFSAEYVSGYILERVVGVCPWDYSRVKYSVDGFIRLDFAPIWFAVGLWFEYVYIKILYI